MDVAIPSDGNVRKKEHEELEKYQGLKEELEKAWRVKTTVAPVVIGELGGGSGPQAGAVAATDPWKHDRHLGPGDTRTLKPLLEDPSLWRRGHAQRVRWELFI